jgi:hypothetical protein
VADSSQTLANVLTTGVNNSLRPKKAIANAPISNTYFKKERLGFGGTAPNVGDVRLAIFLDFLLEKFD